MAVNRQQWWYDVENVVFEWKNGVLVAQVYIKDLDREVRAHPHYRFHPRIGLEYNIRVKPHHLYADKVAKGEDRTFYVGNGKGRPQPRGRQLQEGSWSPESDVEWDTSPQVHGWVQFGQKTYTNDEGKETRQLVLPRHKQCGLLIEPDPSWAKVMRGIPGATEEDSQPQPGMVYPVKFGDKLNFLQALPTGRPMTAEQYAEQEAAAAEEFEKVLEQAAPKAEPGPEVETLDGSEKLLARSVLGIPAAQKLGRAVVEKAYGDEFAKADPAKQKAPLLKVANLHRRKMLDRAKQAIEAWLDEQKAAAEAKPETEAKAPETPATQAATAEAPAEAQPEAKAEPTVVTRAPRASRSKRPPKGAAATAASN